MGRWMTGAIASCLVLLMGCGGAESGSEYDGPVLRFSAIPDENTTELKQKFEPVAEYLSGALSVPVEYVPSSDYGASVDMFKTGDIHLAWFGGLTGVQARQAVPEARAIAQGVEDPNYFSYFIANRSTELEYSDDFPQGIAGRTFTFGSPQSTSGRLMPEAFIRANTGKSPREFFGRECGFSGSHDKTIEQVANGVYDVGAVNYRTYDGMVADGRVDPNECIVIWRSPTYADYNFTAHPALDTTFGAGFIDRLQTALIDMKDPALLDAFRRTALIPADNDDFADVLTVAREVGMAR